MKSLKILIATAAIALPLQFAQAEDESITAQIVMPTITGFDSGMGVALGYEMPKPDLNENLSIEVEFTTTMSPADTSWSGWGTTLTSELSYYTLGGYAKYNFEINEALDVYGRVGLVYESIEISTSCSGAGCAGFAGATASDSDTGMSYGAGINYEFSDQMELTAGYTKIEADISHMSAGIKYKM